MTEDYLSYLKNNSKYLVVGTALLGVLLVGGIMSSLSLSSSGGYSQNQELSASGGLGGSYDAAKADTRTSLPGPRPHNGGDPDAEEKKVITSYNIGFEADDVKSALSETEELAADYGGWTDSQNYNSDRTDSGHITVRVPTENVSEFLDEAENSWKLENKNQNKQDVTSRYTELQLELKNKRQELQRLEEMMNKTDEVDNLIKIQERMSEIRTRVQYLENQMENIDQRVDYTEIRISFEEPEAFSTEFELRETFNNAFQGIFESLKLIIVGTGYLLPFGLILALIHYGRRALKRRD